MAEIQTMLTELAQGRMIVLVDDEDRENEGDLLIPACFANAENINFMARYGRGLICLTLTETHCQRLQLPMMATSNSSVFGTNFTVSVEAAHGVGTGISAQDRATTVMAAANPNATAADLVSPGHVFPLRAEPGGVLVRAGHTEAGCDLAQMAGLFPAAVICEIMNEDGSMARMPELKTFAQEHGLQIGTIRSLIEHRLKHEQLVERQYETTVNTMCGEFRLVVYKDSIDQRQHLVFCRGTIDPQQALAVRVMINPTVLDGLLLNGADGASSKETASSWSALPALARIEQEGSGILLLLSVEDGSMEEKIQRHIGMLPPAAAVASGGSLRHYGLGAQILRDLGAGKINLLSGKLHLPNMQAFGLTVEQVIES